MLTIQAGVLLLSMIALHYGVCKMSAISFTIQFPLSSICYSVTVCSLLGLIAVLSPLFDRSGLDRAYVW